MLASTSSGFDKLRLRQAQASTSSASVGWLSLSKPTLLQANFVDGLMDLQIKNLSRPPHDREGETPSFRQNYYLKIYLCLC